jgi:hypothetical protein
MSREHTFQSADTISIDTISTDLLDSLIENVESASAENDRSAPPSIPGPQGLVLGKIVGHRGPLPIVAFEWNGREINDAAIAVAGSLGQVSDLGAIVCLSFDRGDIHRPIVLGKIITSPEQSAPSAPASVRIEDSKEIVLKCGKASLQLKADGSVAIRGTNLVSRASHTNRIRGGNVQIN